MASSAKVRPGSRFRDADVTAMLEDEDVGLVVSIRAFPTGPYGGGVRWKRPCFSLVFFALSLSLSPCLSWHMSLQGLSLAAESSQQSSKAASLRGEDADTAAH